MKTWKTKNLKHLAEAFLSLETPPEMLNFLRDLCTIEELQEMSQRWQAVTLINKGIAYREIAKTTGLSTTTVTRIAHWLNHGEGGYKSALMKRNKIS